MVQQSYHSTCFILLSLIFLAALTHKEVAANVALRPYHLDGDYNHGYRRYSIFRRQSKGDTGFRTDLGKRFVGGVVEAPMKYFRDDDFSYEDLNDINEQKRRMFRNDLGKK